MNEAVKRDAHEYGLHVKQGGWRLGLLVARSVEKGDPKSNLKGQKTPANTESRRRGSGKVTIAAFSKESGVTQARISTHLNAWEAAAEVKRVPAAATLAPGVEVALPKAEAWDEFYTPVTGGYNGSSKRTPTIKEAVDVLSKLSAPKRAAVAAATLDDEEVAEALGENDDAIDHVHSAMTIASGIGRGEPTKRRKSTKMQEMTVVLALMGVLGQIRDLAKHDSDSPLIKECANLMRETLEILDGIAEADDPDAVERMLSDFGDFLSAQ